jgi:hypothetical protein
MLIGLIIGIVAFVLDRQLAYFTAGQALMTGIAAALERFLNLIR